MSTLDPSKSWNGEAPLLSELEMPLDLPNFEYTPDFAKIFNDSPIDAFLKAKAANTQLNSVYYAGPYIFHCKGIWAKSVTKLVFSEKFPLDTKSFLYFFFSSITLDYMRLSDACSFCLSRIALSENKDQLNIIFKAFSDAYVAANPYIKCSTEEIETIVKACIIHSGFHVQNSTFPKEKFFELLKDVKESEEMKNKIYEEMLSRPIPLFFTFQDFNSPPEYAKKGMLKKIGGFFKSKKERLFVIDGFILKYYHDKSMKEQIGEIDIAGTVSTHEPKQKKDDEHLLIKNINGGPIGYKMSKEGIRKKSNHTDYAAYADKSEDIESWKSTLNLISFWCIMNQIVGQ